MPIDIQMRPVTELLPAPYNPRRPLTTTARKKLRASVETFGLVEPLVWNRRTGHVVGGHARLGIIQELGLAEVPVSVVDLDPANERALNVVLNNREAQGRFDPDKLAALLTELEHLPELPLTGFTARDLASLRLEPVAELPPEAALENVEVTLTFTPAEYTTAERVLDEWAAAGVGVRVRR